MVEIECRMDTSIVLVAYVENFDGGVSAYGSTYDIYHNSYKSVHNFTHEHHCMAVSSDKLYVSSLIFSNNWVISGH